jgi:CO dehydrogenase/acetyl-CoA synthase alpha subunit
MTEKRKEKSYSYEDFRHKFYPNTPPEAWEEVTTEADAWAKVWVEAMSKRMDDQRVEAERREEALS